MSNCAGMDELAELKNMADLFKRKIESVTLDNNIELKKEYSSKLFSVLFRIEDISGEWYKPNMY